MKTSPATTLPLILLTALVAVFADDAYSNDRPTTAARRVAKEIRREALLPPNGPHGRPLPLAGNWNVGTVRGTFEPDHQIGLIQRGHHVLPWMPDYQKVTIDVPRAGAFYLITEGSGQVRRIVSFAAAE